MVNLSARTVLLLLFFPLVGELFAEDRVKSLMVEFQTGSASRQRVVMKKLIEHDEPFLLPFFIKQLKTEDPIVRALAYEGIGQYPEPQILSIMKNGLAETSPLLKEHLLSLFSLFSSEEAIGLIVPFMEDEERILKLTAARVLGHIGRMETIEFLSPSFNSPLEEIRAEALKAVLNIVKNNHGTLYEDFDSEYGKARKDAAFKRLSSLLNSTLPFIEESLRSRGVSKMERDYAAALFAIYSRFIPSKLDTYSLFEEEVPYLLRAKSISDRLGDTAENLINIVSDQPPQVRALILASAGRYPTPLMVAALIEGLSDSFYLVRLTSIEGLSTLRPPGSAQKILGLIDDENHYVRVAALKALLAFSGEIDLVSHISPLRNDPDPHIRWSAIKILGEENRLSKGELVTLLSSPHARIRAAALRYIPNSGDKGVALGLAKVGAGDISSLVREESVRTLSTLGESASKTTILNRLLLDPAIPVRRGAINLMVEEVSHLTKKLDSRRQKIVVKLLKDRDHYVRRRAVEILGIAGGEGAIIPLKSLLTNESNPEIMDLAKTSLERVSLKIKGGEKR